jgi:hypothetical protein
VRRALVKRVAGALTPQFPSQETARPRHEAGWWHPFAGGGLPDVPLGSAGPPGRTTEVVREGGHGQAADGRRLGGP